MDFMKVANKQVNAKAVSIASTATTGTTRRNADVSTVWDIFTVLAAEMLVAVLDAAYTSGTFAIDTLGLLASEISLKAGYRKAELDDLGTLKAANKRARSATRDLQDNFILNGRDVLVARKDISGSQLCRYFVLPLDGMPDEIRQDVWGWFSTYTDSVCTPANGMVTDGSKFRPELVAKMQTKRNQIQKQAEKAEAEKAEAEKVKTDKAKDPLKK